jgi:hypothetical protein
MHGRDFQNRCRTLKTFAAWREANNKMELISKTQFKNEIKDREKKTMSTISHNERELLCLTMSDQNIQDIVRAVVANLLISTNLDNK